MSLRPPVYLSNWIFLSEAGSRIVPTVIRVLYVVFNTGGWFTLLDT